MNITKVFDNAFKRIQEKNWPSIYVLVDLHGTIFKPCYNDEETYEAYPYALETLKLMNDSQKIDIILWSSTKRYELNKYFLYLADKEIYIDWINQSDMEIGPDDPSSMDFTMKPYFNVGIDDKFGFEPETDWKEIYDYLLTKNI